MSGLLVDPAFTMDFAFQYGVCLAPAATTAVEVGASAVDYRTQQHPLLLERS